ncbi:DUF5681 domain-containing protein [Hymenobacter aerilatus]|uniref:DUF5681 domain-containing protein n=1 Tax=Hymenobacter aerilatus TaxID=2932251 RepID=A0A8T9SZS7_9BACT|nr:DUF5681 domain-containing protein [Hymenobacter aerilatus]UOR06213.1 DUF5681 domain-containing protein [Hymenobacter aerilatus]
MQYEQGQSGNSAGRPKGSQNKATTHARELIGAALAGLDADILRAHLLSLNGKEFIDSYVKLAQFITPKLQRTALAADDEESPVTVTLHIGGTPEQREANRQAARRLLRE